MNWIRRNLKAIGIISGGLLLFGGLLSFILLRREDRGFRNEQCAADNTTQGFTRWKSTDFPVANHFDDAELAKSASTAAARWGRETKLALFARPAPMDMLGRTRCKDVGPPNDPVVFVIRTNDDGSATEHAHAHLYWDRSCKLRCVEISFPALAPPHLWNQIMTHEYGHALGLDHDDFEDSVMYFGGKAMAWGVDTITESDRTLLIETYK